MNKRHSIFLYLTIIVLIAGCAQPHGQFKIPKDAAALEVAFSWEGIAPCTHTSPEIQVSAIPDGAKTLRVKLTNLTVPEWNQGGGDVAVNTTGIIPTGALKIGYNGPCPPPGKRHKYEFSVIALNAEGNVIGFGKARQAFPPKK